MNTFKTAKNLGLLGVNNRTLRARGALTSRDRVDIYRYTVPANSALQLRSSLQVQRGGLSISLFIRNPATNQIQRVGGQRIVPGNYTLPFASPASPVDVTSYIRFDRPTRNRALYRLSIDPIL